MKWFLLIIGLTLTIAQSWAIGKNIPKAGAADYFIPAIIFLFSVVTFLTKREVRNFDNTIKGYSNQLGELSEHITGNHNELQQKMLEFEKNLYQQGVDIKDLNRRLGRIKDV